MYFILIYGLIFGIILQFVGLLTIDYSSDDAESTQNTTVASPVWDSEKTNTNVSTNLVDIRKKYLSFARLSRKRNRIGLSLYQSKQKKKRNKQKKCLLNWTRMKQRRAEIRNKANLMYRMYLEDEVSTDEYSESGDDNNDSISNVLNSHEHCIFGDKKYSLILRDLDRKRREIMNMMQQLVNVGNQNQCVEKDSDLDMNNTIIEGPSDRTFNSGFLKKVTEKGEEIFNRIARYVPGLRTRYNVDISSKSPTSANINNANTLINCSIAGNSDSNEMEFEPASMSNNCSLQQHIDEDDLDLVWPNYMENAYKMMSSKELLVPFIKKLDQVHVLDDFILMMKLVAEGSLKADNLPLLLAVERAKFQHCCSSTQMKYRKETIDFWQVVMRQCHRGGLLLFSGLKNAGQLSANLCEKSKYPPEEASINFAVPHPDTLIRHQTSMPKIIRPGIIEESFKLIDKDKQHILIYDGKRLAKGIEGKDSGDINLWGLEGPPNIEQMCKALEEDLQHVAELEGVDIHFGQKHVDTLHMLLKRITSRIKDMRMKEISHQRAKINLQKLMDSHPITAKKYRYAFSSVKANIYMCQNWIKRALELNRLICKILSLINRTYSSYTEQSLLQFSQQGNMRCLFPPEILANKIDLDANPHLIKQRSDLWMQKRKQCHITGSSMFNALGVSTLKEQRQHYRQHVLCNEEFHPSSTVKKYMEHGTKNECNATATIAGILLPALKPHCARLFEDGCNFLDGDEMKPLMEISTDGTIRCLSHLDNERCVTKYNSDHEDLIIEIKCPFPKMDILTIQYEVPLRYVMQMLSEMHVKNVRKGWFVSYTEQSTVLIEVYFNEEMWQEVWEYTKKLYDCKNPKGPMKKDKYADELKSQLQTYIRSNSQILAEVPSIKGVEDNYEDLDASSPYRSSVMAPMYPYNKAEIVDLITSVTGTMINILEESHELQRNAATEILAFILTDTERIRTKSNIPHVPIAYALKGASLPSVKMRQLIDIVREKCVEENISILCEVSDAQWASIAFRDKSQYPLTRIQLQKKIWNWALGQKKIKLIEFLEGMCRPTRCELTNLSKVRRNEVSTHKGVIDIQWTKKDIVFIGSDDTSETITINNVNNHQLRETFMKLIKPPLPCNEPSLWHLGDTDFIKHSSYSEITPDELLQYIPDELLDNGPNELQVAVEESNALHLRSHIPGESVMDVSDSFSISECDSDSGMEVTVTTLLDDVLEELRKLNCKDIWRLINTRMLYTRYLQKASVIADCFIVKELDKINEMVKLHTNKSIFRVNENKQMKVNKIAATFGDKSIWESFRIVHKSPSSLRVLCHKLVIRCYPKKLICRSVCNVKYDEDYNVWCNKSPIPLMVNIEFEKDRREFELFSFPELNDVSECMEPRTIDPTHILTNLRGHVTRKGFNGISKEAFIRVCECKPELLPKTLIVDNLDQQNTDIAKRVFSEEVQECMEQNGDFKEAEFVQLTRNWYNACDQRGLDPLTRIKYLIDFHDYLVNDVKFDVFPPMMSYVKGIPIVTYESILQGISTRLYLYALAKNHTYNQRAVSSLAVESFFADLSRAEFTSTGCPKASKIDKLMSIVLEINAHKHDPCKKFTMDNRRGAPYPVHQLELIPSSNLSYVPHFFDKHKKVGKLRIKFRPTISLPYKTQRGTRSVRSDNYTINESKLTALQKLNLPENVDL